jgi:4-amino-4-deoxy-L-arabinose transferase-like glycosyltransferase
MIGEMLLLGLALHQFSAPIRGGDGSEYLRLGSNLVHHHVFSDAQQAPFDANVLRAPGYPGLLALLQVLGLRSLAAIRLFQLALLGLTAWITGLTATRIAGERAGKVAALLTATYLPLVWMTTEQMTEIAAALGFALLALLILTARQRSGREAMWIWATAGLTLAATAYVRPTALALAVPVAICIACDTKRLAFAAVFAVTVAAAVAPWTIRTSLHAHRLVALQVGEGAGRYASAEQYVGRLPTPLDGNAWLAFKQVSRHLSHDLRQGAYTPTEQVEFDRRMARAAPPVPVGDVIAGLPTRLRALWGPADGTPGSERWTLSARWLAHLQYWLIAVLFCAGVTLRRRSVWRDWPLWLPAIYITAVHLVIHVESRYSLPVRPALVAIAAAAACRLAESPAFSDRRLAPAGGI